MYVISAVLFLLPWSLWFGAWRVAKRRRTVESLAKWRRCVFYAALAAASASTGLHMLWNASWLECGGSPHGMGAGPGLWEEVGPFLVWSFIAGTLLSLFGRGLARFLMLGWTVSMWVVFQLIYLLQFD